MWVLATLVAACFQIARTAMQQKLRAVVGVNAAGFVRYTFGAPLAIAAVCVGLIGRRSMPPIDTTFIAIVAVAGVAQILGTNLLIRSFALRDFAIGTAYSKSETVQVAILSAVVLGEGIGAFDVVGIAITLVGVVGLALRGDLSKLREVLAAKGDPAMWTGLGAGAGLGVAAIAIRAAAKRLGVDDPVLRAVVVLALMNTIQTLLHGSYLFARSRSDLAAVRANWRSSAVVGALSVGGSAGWAIAMTLHNAAIVRAVGNIDLVLAFLVARFWFHEPRLRSEYVASAIVMVGVITVLAI